VNTGVRRFFAPDSMANRVAVVTGGGSGIGLAIAEGLANAGADVLITSRSADRLADAEQRLTENTGRLCASVVCDVREADDVARLRDYAHDRFGKVSIVINNAAANFRMPADRMTERAMRAVLETDLLGTFTVTKEFLPDMIAAGGGSILSVTIANAERGFPGFSHAGAAKTAISSLTCSWAAEWGPHGIRANAMALGPIPTVGVTVNMLGRDAVHTSAAFDEFRAEVPVRRLGTAEDAACAAVFLCSDAASWITGVSLTIDGGLSLSKGA
jgi:NAD(P)-dependent dehydrogenase (short-subunit alcohol dehydrogenase family)